MGFMDKVKNMIGIEKDYYDDDYDDDGYYDAPEEENTREEDSYNESYTEPSATRTTYSESSHSTSRRSTSTGSNVVSMAMSSAKMKIVIQEPMSYDDGPSVLDHIMSGKTVVLNLEMMEVEKKRQIFDFVSGGIYSLSGNIQKVTKDIFVIVPKGVQVDGNIVDKMAQSSIYQL
ncbi:MAG: cell division protein SepF [Ndongobacter sp.]|nr:cell division protein SepF [Ndongobacter sp.]